MKTTGLNQIAFPLHARSGMTLVEVMIALFIAAVTLAGIVKGYMYCTESSVKEGLYMAANARALERIEETRSATWDTVAGVDQLVVSNFPDQTVTLDMSGTGSNVFSATLKTQISPISASPPVRRIRVDCIWQFRGVQWITNTIETCRAPN